MARGFDHKIARGIEKGRIFQDDSGRNNFLKRPGEILMAGPSALERKPLASEEARSFFPDIPQLDQDGPEVLFQKDPRGWEFLGIGIVEG